MSRSDLSRLTV